jgi:hypothetical protein
VDPLEAQQLGQFAVQQPSFWHEVRGSLVTSRLPVGRPATLLDIGAGGGQLGHIVRRDRPDTTYRFVEPLDSIAERLEDLNGEGSRVRDLSVCEVSDVDVFALLDVVEHIEDDRGFLRDIVQRARPGATFVLTVPALSMLWSSWDEQLGHYRRYTRKSARDLTSATALDSVEIGYLFPELVPAGLLRRVMRSRTLPTSEDAAFPQLPRRVDRLLLGFSGLTCRARRWWPVGTSVAVIATRASFESRATRPGWLEQRRR